MQRKMVQFAKPRHQKVLELFNIIRDPWSVETDLQIVETVKEVGKKWSYLSKVLSGRTQHAIKNRYKALLKKERKSQKQDTERDSHTKNIDLKKAFVKVIENGHTALQTPELLEAKLRECILRKLREKVTSISETDLECSSSPKSMDAHQSEEEQDLIVKVTHIR